MAVYRIRGAPRAPPRQGPRQLHRANARPRWLGQLARLGEPRRAAAGYPPPGPEPRCPAPVRGLRKLPDSGHPPLACPRARGPPQSRTPVWVLPDCFQNSFAPLTLFTIHTSTIQTPSSAKCNSWQGTSAVTSGQWPSTSKLNEAAANHRSIIAHCSLFIVHCSLAIGHWPLHLPHSLDEGDLIDFFQGGQAEPNLIQRRLSQKSHSFLPRRAPDLRGRLLGQNHLPNPIA